MGSVRGVAVASRATAWCAVGGLVEAALAAGSRDAWGRFKTLPDQPGADLATAVTDVATLAAFLAWTWLLAMATLTVLAAVDGADRPRLEALATRLVPVAARRVLLALLGVGVLMLPAHPAAAARFDSPQSVASAGVKLGELQSRAPASLLQGLPLPDRPTGQTALGHRPHQGSRVVVLPGDTLWDIAARSLGPRASTSAIARAWPAWFAANRSAIGDDPDLIVPGTVLQAPPQHPLARPPGDERS